MLLLLLLLLLLLHQHGLLLLLFKHGLLLVPEFLLGSSHFGRVGPRVGRRGVNAKSIGRGSPSGRRVDTGVVRGYHEDRGATTVIHGCTTPTVREGGPTRIKFPGLLSLHLGLLLLLLYPGGAFKFPFLRHHTGS